MTIGCFFQTVESDPPAGVVHNGVTGLACTGEGNLPSCQLCPSSATYWRNAPPAPRPHVEPTTDGRPVAYGPMLRPEDGWTKTGPSRPCVDCGQPAMMRSPAGVPQHRVCAEARMSDPSATIPA